MPNQTKQTRTSEPSAFELSPITDYNKNREIKLGQKRQ